MQQINDPSLENWHDYEVQSRREIVALLRGIRDKNQLVRMLISGEADVCVTSVLDVDPDAGHVIVDCSIDRDQNRRALAAGKVSFETFLDKIRILFAAPSVAETTFENRPALKIAIPETLIRLQRREFYRMPTPVSNPIKVVVPLPAELGGGTQAFPLADISCGGVAILDNSKVLGETAGLTLDNCRLELPEVGPVITSLQVRNMMDLTLLNNKTNRRLGCQFVNISRGNLANVQKYITKLERERNARLSGLA